MKNTLLLAAFAALSLTSFAKEKIELPAEMVSETVIETQIVPVQEAKPLNIYAKAGINFAGNYDKYSVFDQDINRDGSSGTGWEIALEVTENITPNFEFGVGIAYQKHSKVRSYSEVYNQGSYTDVSTNETIEYYDEFKSSMQNYQSVPVYAVAKYNFEAKNEFVPYVKAHLGYSFNIKDGNSKAEDIENWGGEEELFGKYDRSSKIKNGAYVGIGVGVEKDSFFADLMFQKTYAMAENVYDDGDYIYNVKDDLNYSRWTLAAGYKF